MTLTAFWVLALLAVAGWLEHLTQRPFLATLAGRALAWCLGAERRECGGTFFAAPRLPAVGFRAAGQTWGETVLVVGYNPSPALLAHEACHVAQYRAHTSLGFWARYALEWLLGLCRTRSPYRAYLSISLEREAREAAEVWAILQTERARTS